MIIKKNEAIIETLSEFDLFEELFYEIPSETKYFFKFLKDKKYTVDKQQLKDKLQIHKNSNILIFGENVLTAYPEYLPDLGKNDESNITNINIFSNHKIYFLPVNILTINKNNKELYELGKWCMLWD